MKQETIKTWLFDPELKPIPAEKIHDEKVNRLLKKVGKKLESVVNYAVGHCAVTVIVWRE